MTMAADVSCTLLISRRRVACERPIVLELVYIKYSLFAQAFIVSVYNLALQVL